MRSPILAVVVPLAISLILLTSVYLLVRGHNEPGGGFIAGLMTSAGIALLAVAFGLDRVRRVLPLDFKQVVALGLLLAAGTGVGAVVLGYPFLTHTFGHVSIPLYGEVELATAVLFDLGVYLVVVGTMMAVISIISDEASGRPAGDQSP